MSEKESKIKVLVVEPMKAPVIKEIDNTLKSLQSIVGGYIQAVYPYNDNVALVLNEEGKLEGLPANRGLFDENGNLYDIIVGNFIVVGLGEEDFCSLTDEQVETYYSVFEIPEMFIRSGKGVIAIPME